jgi:Probable cobalt transporter subunit (CbtA)
MSARSLLVRGMLVGLAAGLLANAFGTLFGESQINQAIAFEYAHTPPGMHDPETVSRTVQSTIGLTVAVLVYGAALGGIFALAFAFSYGRLGQLSARVTAVLVAGLGFGAVFLVPFLKYPANPPAVGEPDTIGRRTALYFLMVLISVAGTVGAVLLGRSLTERLGGWNAALVAIGAFIVVAAIAAAILPGINEVPEDFPAVVLWRFRLSSVGTQLVLWGTLGLLFGALTERAARRQAQALSAATAG